VASGMGGLPQPQTQHRSVQGEGWPARQAAPASGAVDLQNRLSEAMVGATGRMDFNARGAVPPPPAQGRRAPGEVHIKEGPIQLAPVSPLGPVRERTQGADRAEFPGYPRHGSGVNSGESEAAVGAPQAPFVYQRQPVKAPGKTSLLRRLTGVGRGKVDAAGDKHSHSREDAVGSREQADLPVFFGRGKR
jgi:hypothetical protein